MAAMYWRARSIAFRAVESERTGGCVGSFGKSAGSSAGRCRDTRYLRGKASRL
jgi:hypothetical protein